MLAMNYGPADDPRAVLQRRRQGTISVYAQNRDYHDVIKGRLKEIAGKLAARSGAEVKVFVDTAPVMEKPLAEAAGLGWQGKHTNLVSRAFGSWLFLGTIFTTADLGSGRAGRGPLRLLPRLPRHLPDRRPFQRPTGSMRGAASPISPSRTRVRSRGEFRERDRQPHLWLRRLPGGLPVEQVRAHCSASSSSRRATDLTAPPLAACWPWTTRLPAAFRRLAGQAHRPRPVLPQRADRGRQFGRCVAGRPGAGARVATARRWCAARLYGRCRD